MNMKYIAYIRRSSDRDDKQVESIDAQLRELKKIAERENIEVVDYMVESQSAYKPGRPVFAEMLERLKRGEAEGIFVWHISRLSRNPIDGGMLIWLLDEGVIKEIRTTQRSYYKTGDDMFFMAIEFGMSKKGSDDTSEFVKRDAKSKLLKGEWVGMVPVGYLNLTSKGVIAGKMYAQDKQTLLHASGRSLKRAEIDPIIGPLMRNFFDWYMASPRTLKESAAYINALDIKSPRFKGKYSTSMVERILKNPFYAGQLRYEGEIFPGTHDPIITMNEFEGIQRFLKGNAHPQTTKHDFPLRKLAKCDSCGCAIVGVRKRKPSGKVYEYYTCSRRRGPCNQPPMPIPAVHELAGHRLKEVRMEKEDWLLCKRLVALHFSDQIQKDENAKQHAQRELNGVQKRLDALLDMHLSELLTKEEFLEKKNALMSEKSRLEQATKGARVGSRHWLLEAEEFFDKAYHAFDRFTDPATPLEEKKTIVREIGWNLRLRGENLMFDYKKPFDVLARRYGQKQAVGTLYLGEDKKKNTSSEDEVSFWRDGRDSNPQLLP